MFIDQHRVSSCFQHDESDPLHEGQRYEATYAKRSAMIHDLVTDVYMAASARR
jgi:hypothetical protein